MATSKRFKTIVEQDTDSTACGMVIPFDPREVFGKVRVPVIATLRTYSYQTTICSMGGRYLIPFAKKHREAAGVAAGDSIFVTLEHDEAPRSISPPADLAAAIKSSPAVQNAWSALSFTHQREHVEAIEEAKRPATRERRIAATLKMLGVVNPPQGTSKTTSSSMAGVSDTAVKKSTGKGWVQWMALLDKAGAKTKTHKAIAQLLQSTYNVDHWWAQQITVAYEQARLGRKKHEKPSGYEVSGSKTINVPIAELYKAWHDKRRRKRWLPESDFVVRKATPEKSMRITWVDDVTHVDVYFTEKNSSKSHVAVQHKKLKASQTDSIKAIWRERLANLKQMLEGG